MFQGFKPIMKSELFWLWHNTGICTVAQNSFQHFPSCRFYWVILLYISCCHNHDIKKCPIMKMLVSISLLNKLPSDDSNRGSS